MHRILASAVVALLAVQGAGPPATRAVSVHTLKDSMSKRAWPLCAVLLMSACASYVEVPVETPLQSKIDVQRFRRALVAGFLVDTNGGELDLQAETVRLLENQLKTRTKLQVLEADRPPLQDA